MDKKENYLLKRRKAVKSFFRSMLAIITGVFFVFVTLKFKKNKMVWQIDPGKCVRCGRCANDCVLSQSAVKCFHEFTMCGYCRLCFGYFKPGTRMLHEGAENQLCPTGAINRKYIEEPYFEYTINEDLCIGCGKCIEGCNSFGNGSLYLQINHNICTQCNDCSIARVCAGNAIQRFPLHKLYFKRNNQANV